MEFINITDKQYKIIEALARYKFLTISQMIRLGISKEKSSLRKILNKLKSDNIKAIGSIKVGIITDKGKAEYVYHLKPAGAKILLEGNIHPDTIKIPQSRAVKYFRDYFHRKFTIDFEIALQQYADSNGCTLLLSHRYFDKIGNNRKDANLQAVTKIPLKNDRYLIADGIFKIETPQGVKLYCFEQYNGKDTGRTYKQLRQYLEALETASPSVQFEHDRGFRILAVFEHESIMQATIERVQASKNFDNVRDFYLFKPYKAVMQGNVFDNWFTADGTMITLY